MLVIGLELKPKALVLTPKALLLLSLALDLCLMVLSCYWHDIGYNKDNA